MNPQLKEIFAYLSEAEPDDKIPKCDAIFVFGTTNDDVAKHAAHLYQEKKADWLIFTGRHRADKTEGPKGFPSEAEYFASTAIKAGVPRSRIILDTRSTNTFENVVFGMEAARKAGLSPKSLILVSVPYLLRRAKACFEKNAPEIKIYRSAMSVSDTFFTPHRIERIKGEFPRFTQYAKQETIAPVEVPAHIAKLVGELRC